jgi:serine/threonine protein kinase
MIDEYGRAFISDIGIAKQMEYNLQGRSSDIIPNAWGEKNWMAPEIFSYFSSPVPDIPSHQTKFDVFSLGLIFLYSIDRDGFMKRKGTLNYDKKILKEYIMEIEKKGLIYDREFLTVLKKILDFDINSRISIQELYYWMVYLYKINILTRSFS